MPEALRRRKILVVPHDLDEAGGGTCVAAWTLMALRDDYDVTVLTWTLPDLDVTNRNFGTNLQARDIEWRAIDTGWRWLLAIIPLRLALVRNHLLFRKAKQLRRAERVDFVLGAANEIDVGGPTIQYIHFPWAFWPRPDCDLQWYHWTPLVRLYRSCVAWISGYDQERVAHNRTLANSDWTSRLFEEWYGGRAKTVYPPVPGGFPERAFEDRQQRFVCIGRISPEKRLEDIIEILARVRELGHEAGLHIIGHKDDPSYLEKLVQAAAPHRDWISFHHGIPRAEMVELVSECRYGIHAMEDEHFGIAVAELQRGGCIPFIRNGGGAVEIVDRDERLIFASVEDAVAKIDRVLRDEALQAELRADVERRRMRFTEERFMREIQEAVAAEATRLDEGPGKAASERAASG